MVEGFPIHYGNYMSGPPPEVQWRSEPISRPSENDRVSMHPPLLLNDSDRFLLWLMLVLQLMILLKKS